MFVTPNDSFLSLCIAISNRSFDIHDPSDDIWHLFVGHEEETEDGEALETVCGTVVDDNSIAKDPSHRRDAFDKARRVRTESMRRHYHDLIYPAPCSPFDAASRPLSEAVLVHMQEERSRSIDRSSLMGLEL